MIARKQIKLWVVVVCLLGFFVGCTKSKDPLSDPDQYYIKFKIDGAAVQFTDKFHEQETDYITAANSIFGNGNYLHILTGSLSATDLINHKNTMSLSLLTPKDLKTGITFATSTSLSDNYLQSIAFALGYTDGNGKQYVCFGDDIAPYVLQQQGITISTQNKITFSEIASDHVKGTFYGTLYADDFSIEKKLTDGEF